MKKRTKSLIIAFCTMALCICLIVGSTFALFSSNSSVNIAITSGQVKVVATTDTLKTYSVEPENVGCDKNDSINYSDNTNGTKLISGTYHYVEQPQGTFKNGGTATLTSSDGKGQLTVERITPGDKLTFELKVENQSTVAAKYRVKFYCEGYENNNDSTDNSKQLFDSLNIQIPLNGTTYYKSANSGVLSYTTAWTDLAVSGQIVGSTIMVELPLSAGYSVQKQSCKFYYYVEAVQGNAIVSEDLTETVSTNGISKTVSVSASGTTVTLDNALYNKDLTSSNTTKTNVQLVIPSGAVNNTENVDITLTETAVSSDVEVSASDTVYSFNITATGLSKVTNGYYEIKFYIGINNEISSVYHNSDSLSNNNSNDEYYVYDENGYITIYTKLLSPFVVSYKFAGGNGSEDYPYLISTANQISAISAISCDGNFRVINDITDETITEIKIPDNVTIV
jgi:hypothetical protein